MQFLFGMNIVMVFLLGGVVTGGYWIISYDDGSSYTIQKQNVVKQLKQLEVDISEAHLDMKKIHSFDKTVQQLGNSVQAFLIQYIPENLKPSTIYTDLTRSAKETGVSIVNLTNSGIKSTRLYDTLSFKLTIEGGFVQALRFLSLLTSLDQIVTVNNVNISSQASRGGRETSQSPTVTVTMDVNGYRYVEPTPAKKSQKKNS